MTNKVLAFLTGSMLVGSLAVPLSAQTITLKANVPFQFMVEGKTMPAGEYLIQKDETSQFLRLSDYVQDASILVPLAGGATLDKGNLYQAKLYFDKYGDKYFLSGIWDGYDDVGYFMHKSRTERELSHNASLRQPESAVVLAKR